MATKVIITETLPVENIDAMELALKKEEMPVERTPETIVCTAAGIEVLRGLKGPMGSWIVRRANGLFVSDGVSDKSAGKILRLLRKSGGIQNVSGAVTVE